MKMLNHAKNSHGMFLAPRHQYIDVVFHIPYIATNASSMFILFAAIKMLAIFNIGFFTRFFHITISIHQDCFQPTELHYRYIQTDHPNPYIHRQCHLLLDKGLKHHIFQIVL